MLKKGTKAEESLHAHFPKEDFAPDLSVHGSDDAQGTGMLSWWRGSLRRCSGEFPHIVLKSALPLPKYDETTLWHPLL